MSAKVKEEQGDAPDSEYSIEGTRAHRCAELSAALIFGLIDEEAYTEKLERWQGYTPEDQQDDMIRYAGLYVDMLQGLVEEAPMSNVLLEQRVETGVDFCWGTADAVVVSPTELDVVDYKYGKGVAVSAINNPQLRLYGIGALDTFDELGEIETVRIHIFQPRLGEQSTETLTADELRAWRDDIVRPAAVRALGEEASFGPSLDACRFCPAAGECKPRMLHLTAMDFGDPNILTPEEMAENVMLLAEIRDWCNVLEATALRKAYSEGISLPGLKVVLSGGRRTIIDVDLAVKLLEEHGYPPSATARTSMQTLGVLEKLVGKKDLPELLGDLLVKSEGKPALVPEDDGRPAIDPETDAAKEFE